jgi:hypothetical protein
VFARAAAAMFRSAAQLYTFSGRGASSSTALQSSRGQLSSGQHEDRSACTSVARQRCAYCCC